MDNNKIAVDKNKRGFLTIVIYITVPNEKEQYCIIISNFSKIVISY
jgi:hypothetical protein